MESDLESKIFLNTEDELQTDTTWIQRTFKKMKKGSLRGAIFIMLITALGTGIFTLHHLFNQIGILISILLIAIVGVFFYFAVDFMIAALQKYPECKSLSDLNRKTLNRPMAIIYDTLFAIYMLLVVIAGVASLSRMVYINFETYIWKAIPVDTENQTFATFNTYFPYLLVILLFALVAKKRIDSLRHLSFYSFLIFVFLAIVCIYHMPFYYSDLVQKDENTFNVYDISLVGFFETFGCLVFSYNIINNVFSVINTVQNPTPRRLRKIFSRSFFILGLLSTVIGLSSYLSIGKLKADKVDLFIFRDVIGSSDYVMFIGRCMLIIGFITGSAVNAHSLKIMAFDITKLEMTLLRNIIATTVILFLVSFTVSNFSIITTIVAFAGAFCGTIMVFIYPGLIGLRTGYSQTKVGNSLILLFTIGLGTCGLISSYYSLMNFFESH